MEIQKLALEGRFDYLIIESTGISEVRIGIPLPILRFLWPLYYVVTQKYGPFPLPAQSPCKCPRPSLSRCQDMMLCLK